MKMNYKYLLLGLLLLGSLFCYAQKVSNVQFEQVNSKVKITYSLDKQADIAVSVSEDGGKTWSQPLSHVSGDVGKQVRAGNNTVYWDALADCDKIVGSNICFKVITQGGDVRTITVKGVSFKMIQVEGGTFTMGATSEQGNDAYGDEKPTHRVTLSDYYIGETEVTQALWKAVMGSNPSYYKGDNLPVEQVSWEDCQTFIQKLNSLTGLRFAFPTEAQWEYAARGGKKSKGYKYAGSNSIGQVAWYKDNSNSKTHAVATKQPNELGLYDMSGNVYEWCQDWYGSYSSAAQTNPTGASSGSSRVNRGGGFYYDARYCRVSYRYGDAPTYRSGYLGLRLVLLP
ncbi:MAG: formylglycine-generating enzyme family protein [Paludibacteraceae bacterium]